MKNLKNECIAILVLSHKSVEYGMVYQSKIGSSLEKCIQMPSQFPLLSSKSLLSSSFSLF